jgi:hypothetical protein
MKNRSPYVFLVLVAVVASVLGSVVASADAIVYTPASLVMATSSPGNATWFGATGSWSNQDVSILGTPTLSVATTTTPIPITSLGYSLSGGTLVDITGQRPTLTQEGIYRFDGIGVLDAVSYESTGGVLRIDKTRPTSLSNAVPVYDGTATVTMTATDTLSGVAFVVYSVDGVLGDFTTPLTPYGGSLPLTSTVDVSTPGWHTLSWFSIDRAGNHEFRHTVSFRVNATGYVPILGKPSVSVHRVRKATFRGSVTPATSSRAIVLTLQRKSGKKWKNYATYHATVARYVGTYSVTRHVTKAGTYRVRVAEGAGVSVWSKNFVLR